MRVLLHYCMVLMLLACVSCSSSDFSVEATIKGLGTQNVRVTYASDTGVRDTFFTANNDVLEFKGSSSQLTIVSLWNSQGLLLARFAAENGDNISVEAELATLPLVKVSGSDINDQWTKFRNDHLVLYTNPDKRQLDNAIIQWAQKHPENVLSTILILWDMGDISNKKETLKLLNALQPEARPDHLIDSYEALAEQTLHPQKNLHSLRLCGTNGAFAVLMLNNKRMLLYFWSADDPARIDIVRQLKSHDNSQIADIFMDGDTATWRSTCRNDSAQWKHFWAPSGVMDPSIKGLNITSTPFFVTTDSTTAITYQGQNVKEALDRMK